ncbi:Olfactory receptor 1020 [Cricetulus griseus]|uniref:Olfactory receptor 1020 n=2 Tax=Cricetulus griseus TaxID=10029 RepID=G3HR28_CRIGR|nr:Olfactory receptor 1020 [Cricetulus griseus]
MKGVQDKNDTEVTEFILMGLSDNADLQGVLFALFLVIYMMTLVGNLGMIALIKIDRCLHTPMYFFLSSLSFVDASYSSSVTPKMLVNLMTEDKSISFNGCAAQFFFFGSFLGTECFLLAMMAYDRYAAIWSPLLYPVLMSGRICFMLVTTSFLAGFGNAAIHTGMTFRLSFCGSNKVNHFYCDTPPLLKLSCSDTHINGIVIMVFSTQMIRNLKGVQDKNDTEVTEFILMGLSDNADLQGVLFALFLVIYMMTLVGNLGMIALIKIDRCLHTPMYFFLSSLSFVDASSSSTITPKMLVNLIAEDKSISFNGCAVQFFFFGSFLGTECFLLAMMAYDRYAAIWSPLLYPVLMSGRICFMLVTTSFLAGFGNAAIHTGMTFRLSFCGSNKVNHFYCDTPPLLKLSCSDIHINGIVIMVFSSFTVLSCVLMVLISYLCILIAILKMPSAEGRHKAFSTCASHLMAVTIFFGSILFMYLRPTTSYSMEQDKIDSVFYTVVIPMLNPLIYSLKNKDVKGAVKKILQKHVL